MKVKHGTNVALRKRLFVVSINEECKSNSVSTERWLDNVGHVVLVGFGIEVLHILAGMLLMLRKVIVGSVRNAPKLAPAEGEQELKVGCCL